MRAWDAFINNQEKILGKLATDQWLRALKVLHFDACNLYLEAKDTFQIAWFEEHMRPVLKSSFFNENGRIVKVHLTLQQNEAPVTKVKKKKEPPFSQQQSLDLTRDPLDPRMTLDQFVIGKNNEVIMRFLTELVDHHKLDKKGKFNPIYIFGNAGSGKTHLLMALTAAFQKKGLNALYAKAATFTEHVVNAIRSSQMKECRNAYRHVDLLLIDDVHLLARKNATQEEFFHTFNALHMADKQIILSSHLSPRQLEDIEPRLISRFEWGITFYLEQIEKTQLRNILEQRLLALQFPLTEEIKDFLLERFHCSKSLEKALEALILRSYLKRNEQQGSLCSQPSDVEELLEDLIKSEEKERLTPESIISLVSAQYGVRPEDLLGKSQAREYALPRHLTMYLCRMLLHLPLMAIGRIFHRDHSTVMTSIRQIQNKVESMDKELIGSITEIRRRIGS